MRGPFSFGRWKMINSRAVAGLALATDDDDGGGGCSAASGAQQSQRKINAAQWLRNL